MKTVAMVVCVLVSVSAGRENVHGQDIILGLQGGVPKHYEAYEKYFEHGRLWGGTISTSVASNLELGLGFSRSTWRVVDGNTLEELSFSRDYTPLGWESSGKGTITEVFVSLRLLSRPLSGEKLNFFAQLGAGYYWSRLNASYQNQHMCLAPNYSDPGCYTYGMSMSYDRNNVGLNIGMGAAVHILEKLTVELQPSARVVFIEDGRITYYSIDVSARYRMDLGSCDEP